MAIMREKLTEALAAKANDINSYVWKFAKKPDGTQEEIKLMEATPEQLVQFYKHCYSMLYSTDRVNPGRYTLLDTIKEQREKCTVELYLRKLTEGCYTGGKVYPRHTYCQEILECIRRNKEHFPQSELKNISIATITTGLPKDFEDLSIDSVISGCLDSLGTFSPKHITMNFLINLGIYLTPEEMKDLDEKDEEGNTRSKMEVIKERLHIKPSVRLTVKPTGLNYTELRAMINLKPTDYASIVTNQAIKYSALTTDQLLTLRNKVLFRLEQEIDHHIEQWEERMNQIVKVIKARDLDIDNI